MESAIGRFSAAGRPCYNEARRDGYGPRPAPQDQTMHDTLAHDAEHLDDLLGRTRQIALSFLRQLDGHPAAVPPPPVYPARLPAAGGGAGEALQLFQERILPYLSGSAGSRYLGFVTGGATPAALIGDWLASAVDQNVVSEIDSIAPRIEDETIDLLRQLFGLPDDFSGAFVSGATMANFSGLVLGREWLARRAGVEAARSGLYGLRPIRILAAAPHASIYKALAMAGMGRDQLAVIPGLPGREAVDVEKLAEALAAAAAAGDPCLVVGSAGTVNSVDFDDLAAIGALKERFNFWYHIDAAFGGFAACSPRYRHLTAGMETADSITIDAHKWLNVPYDSGMVFTRHPDVQTAVFQNTAAYLEGIGADPPYVHLTPQNSRRFRALPAWFTLQAYGRAGYREIVERCCALAGRLAGRVDQSDTFERLAPVHLNGVVFAPAPALSETAARALVDRLVLGLRDDGRVFLTPTHFGGRPAVRAAFSSWRTVDRELDVAWEAMTAVLDRVLAEKS